MLFTDTDLISLTDVLNFDPTVADVAASENIPTSGLGSFVHMAIEECANKLLSEFQGFPNYYALQSLVGSVGAMGALQDSTPPPRIVIGQVVVDSTTTTYASPIKRYTAYLALRNFYQIASNRKIDDRYADKLKQVELDLDRKYWPQLKNAGLPIVFSPIACPAAQYELNQGTWDSSNVTEVAGGTASANTWDVAITWVSSQSSPTGIAESAPSQTISMPVDANNVLHIDITSLTPTLSSIISWNIYAGAHTGPLFLQATVPAATKTYTFAGAPVLSGTRVGRGQPADTSLTFLHAFFRG